MKRLIVIFLSVGLILVVIGYSLYNKPHRKAEDEPGIAINASKLFEAFETEEQQANQRFLDKVLVVQGVVASVGTNQDGDQVILLQTGDPIFGIACTMLRAHQEIVNDDLVTIKGFCKGYLSDVVLTECILIENSNDEQP